MNIFALILLKYSHYRASFVETMGFIKCVVPGKASFRHIQKPVTNQSNYLWVA